jgi:hypothetical protein
MLFCAAFLGRFSDWDNVGPTQGFWCQWSGFFTVVGTNSVNLWISATGTYLVLIYFGKNPGLPLEITVLILWPIFAIVPASGPYFFYPPDKVYSPLINGQCYFINTHLLVYLVTIWEVFSLLYILLTYLVAFIHMRDLSKRREFSLVLQKPQDRVKLKKFWISLAVTPIMYWVIFICLVVVRISEIAKMNLPINFTRCAIFMHIMVGACYSLWMGYSADIYVKIFRIYWKNIEEDLLISPNIN